MPYLRLPNGSYVETPEGMSDRDALTKAKEKFPEAFEPAATPKSGTVAAAKAGFQELKGDVAALAGRTGLMDIEKAAKYKAERKREAERIFKPTEEGWLDDPLTKIGELVGGSAPYMLAPAVAGGAALLGGVPALGVAGAAGLASATQFAGSDLSRQMQEGKKLEETDLGAALTAAPFQAALDVTAGRLIPGIGKIFGAAGKKITPDVAKKIAEQGLGKAALDYGVKTGTVATAEGLTEAGQQLLERLQAGLDIQSPEARDEYFQSFLGGAVLGGTLGVPGRYFERRGIIAEGEKLKREEADKQAAKELADKEEQEKVKQAQEEFAKIAAEQKPPALTEEQIATMRGEVDNQRGVLNRELDRLRTQAKATPDVDEYLKISEQADKLQAGLDELDPDKVKTQINKIAKENTALQKQVKAEKDEEKQADLKILLDQGMAKLETLKQKLPALEAVKETAAPKQTLKSVLQQIDKARELGDLAELGRLAKKYKALQGQYTGMEEQGMLLEKQGDLFAYPDAERRETIAARELEATRPDLEPAPKASASEIQMQDAMDILREDLPEVEKKEFKKIDLLPVGNLRGYLADLETKRRTLLENNPELTKLEKDRKKPDIYGQLAKEKYLGYTKQKVVLSDAGIELSKIDEAILDTQRRIEEELLGDKIPKDIPSSLYALPKGYSSAKYTRFAERIGQNGRNAYQNLVETLFNISKGISDDIANTPELLNKKIENLRAIVVKNALREVEARRLANGLESLTKDQALKLALQINFNVTELINRIPALSKKQILDRLEVAFEPRLKVTGEIGKQKFKFLQEDLEKIREDLVKIDDRISKINKTPKAAKLLNLLSRGQNSPEAIKSITTSINNLPGMAFAKQQQKELLEKQARIEESLGNALTGRNLKYELVEELGKATLDPRELDQRPFGNTRRALQIFNEDIEKAKQEAATDVQKNIQKEKPLLKSEGRDPIAGLNKLLPNTRKVTKLKSEIYQAENAPQRNEETIAALKQQLISMSSNPRSAALFLKEIDTLKLAEYAEDQIKAKQEEIDMERYAPSGVKIATEREKAQREETEKPYPIDQQELFGPTELEPIVTVRATPEKFISFLNSSTVFKMRQKLGIFEKKDADLAERKAVKISLVDLRTQQELVNDLENFDKTVSNFRYNAAQLWQGRKKIADALENALAKIEKDTSPKIEELKQKRKKYSFKQYGDEYKSLTKKIEALQNKLNEQNIKNAAMYAAALKEFDETVDERNVAIEAIQARIQDLWVRNVEDEQKILRKMERKFYEQGTTPAMRANKEYATKARAIIAQTEDAIEESTKKRIATKRIEEQQKAESLKQLPVIRRIVEKTHYFVFEDKAKDIRHEIKEIQKKQKRYKPGSSDYASISSQIATLKADLDQAIQPLMRSVIQAELESPSTGTAFSGYIDSSGNLVPEKQPEQRKVGKKVTSALKFEDYTKAPVVQPARTLGKTTGYTYLTNETNSADILEKIQQVAKKDFTIQQRKNIAAISYRKPGKKEVVKKTKITHYKQAEVAARDKLQAAKKELKEQTAAIAKAEAALKKTKSTTKIAEIKTELTELRKAATKAKLSEKINKLTKDYRELRELGTGVEQALKMAEEEAVKETRLGPLKTGLPATKKLAKSLQEESRREIYEREAQEAGVSRSDYVDILDMLDKGFKLRVEEVATGTPLSQSAVQKLLDNIKMPKGLKVVVLDKLPESILQTLDKYGVNPAGTRGWVDSSGTVYIVAGNHTSINDAKETIAHELIGHIGVEGVLGNEGMKALVKKISGQKGYEGQTSYKGAYTGFFGIEKLAGELGVAEDATAAYLSAKKAGKTEEEAKEAAVKEMIAHVAEATATKSFLAKANDFIKAMIGVLRAQLRKMGLELDTNTSDIYKIIRDARKQFDSITPGAYVRGDGEITFRSNVKYNSDFDDVKDDISKIVHREKSLVAKIKGSAAGLIFRTNFIDRFAPIERLTAKMKDALEATQLMYYLRMHDQRLNWTAEIASNGPIDIVEKKRADGQIERVIESKEGPNLKQIAEILARANVGSPQAANELFTFYLAALRAENKGIEKLNFSKDVTPELLAKVMKRIDASPSTKQAFEKAREVYNNYNDGLINFAVKTGAISKKDAATMLKERDYVPYYRPDDKGAIFLDIGVAAPIKIGNLKDQPYLHELVGGDTAIKDMFTSALQNTNLLTDMALRNLATRNVAFSLEKLGFLTPISAKNKASIRNGTGPARADVIRFKVDGEDKHAIVEGFDNVPAELIVKGMEGVKTSLPDLVEYMAMPASTLRKFITRNPVYALRQVVRDSLSASMTSGSNAVPIMGSLKELGKMVRGKSEGEFLLQRKGILGGQVLTGTSEDTKQIMLQITSGKPGWNTAMAKLDKLAIRGDAASRVSMYNSFLKQGLSDMEATLATLESMNFSKRGISPSMFVLNMIVPFMNAQVQGLDVIYKAFAGKMPFNEKLKVKEKLIKRAIMMGGFTLAYTALMYDDEAYKNANPDEKYSNWFMYVPGIDEPVRVPIPFELGLLFKALPEALVNTAFGDEKIKDSSKAIANMVWNSIPISLPAAIKPMVEVSLNKSFFTGREIETKRMQELEASERFTDRTSEIAKVLGKGTGVFGLSPIKLEYLIRGYTGSFPLAVVSLSNPVLRTSEAGDTPTTRASEVPVFGGLFQPKDASGLINKAYHDMDAVIAAKQTYNKKIEEGRIEDAEDYLNEQADLIGMATMAGRFRQRMGDITKQERAVRADPKLSAGEKRQLLDELRQAKIQTAKDFSSARE